MIRFACPKCQTKLTARYELAGRVSKCRCGQSVKIPQATNQRPANVGVLPTLKQSQPTSSRPFPSIGDPTLVSQPPLFSNRTWVALCVVLLVVCFAVAGLVSSLILVMNSGKTTESSDTLALRDPQPNAVRKQVREQNQKGRSDNKNLRKNGVNEEKNQPKTPIAKSKGDEPKDKSDPKKNNDSMGSKNSSNKTTPKKTSNRPNKETTNREKSKNGGRVFVIAFDKLLKEKGAKSGDVQISLFWKNKNDLDLHVICPNGQEIFWAQRRSRCGGELDVDMNVVYATASSQAVENIYWPPGKAPEGRYRVHVNHYRNHGTLDCKDPTQFTVRVLALGQTRTFVGSVVNRDFRRRRVLVHEFVLQSGKVIHKKQK